PRMEGEYRLTKLGRACGAPLDLHRQGSRNVRPPRERARHGGVVELVLAALEQRKGDQRVGRGRRRSEEILVPTYGRHRVAYHGTQRRQEGRLILERDEVSDAMPVVERVVLLRPPEPAHADVEECPRVPLVRLELHQDHPETMILDPAAGAPFLREPER